MADAASILRRRVDRRQSMRMLLAGAAALQGCVGKDDNPGGPDARAMNNLASCSSIPDETGGPFPGDGTAGPGPHAGPPPGAAGMHGPFRGDGPPGPPPGAQPMGGKVANALILSGIVRRDIRPSLAGANGIAKGTPLTMRLRIVDVNAQCTGAAGAAVYVWHCNRDGRYSMYSPDIAGENYLRGVQVADKDGYVEFTTIFPGCYEGRMPHVHVEVYPSLAKAQLAANCIKTSQFTFPDALLRNAYQAPGYGDSVKNLSRISIATDNVFSDGVAHQLAAVTGSVSAGYTATLTAGIALPANTA